MVKEKHIHLIFKAIFLFGYGISIPGLWIIRDNPEAFQLSWIFTTITLVSLLFFHKKFTVKFFVALLVVGILGWAVEAVGTNTGIIFGSYTYGESLGPKVFATPFSMAVNWMLSVYLVVMILKPRILNRWKLAFTGASIMVLYDILLEPVAIRLDMWSWAGGNPPFQNFVAWFIISFPLILLLNKYSSNAKNPLAFFIFICQIAFFVALNVLIEFLGF